MLTIDALREGYSGEAFSEQTDCPFCDGRSRFIANAPNIRPGYQYEFALRRCISCGHMWINPLPMQPFLDYLYALGSESVIHGGYQSEAKPRLSAAEQHVLDAEKGAVPARYFELGLGKGLLYNRFRGMGWNCAGVEPGDWGMGIPGVVRTLEDIEHDTVFDVLVALDVLEHITDPVGVLKELRSVADRDARVYLAFPNRRSLRFAIQKERWRMIRPLGHVHYFSKRSARLMVQRSGFAVRRAKTTDLIDLRTHRDLSGVILGIAQALGAGDQWLVSASPAQASDFA